MQEIFVYFFNKGGAPGKCENLPRSLFSPTRRSIHSCHQKVNLSGDPVPSRTPCTHYSIDTDRRKYCKLFFLHMDLADFLCKSTY